MTLTNEEVKRLNAKVFSVPARSILALTKVLSANESKIGETWTNARHGQLRIEIREHDGDKYLTLTFQLLASYAIGHIVMKLSVADSMKVEESCYYATGSFDSLSIPADSDDMVLVVSDTAIYLRVRGGSMSFFETTNEQRVYRTGFIPDDQMVVSADIQHDNFRNLLNKLGKERGIIHLFSKEDTFAGVLGEENQCLASYYKAGNVTVRSDTQGAVGHSELYDMLYRRKASRAGLYQRVEPTGENVRFGMKPNGNFVIGLRVDDHAVLLEKPNELDSTIEHIDIGSAEISAKKTRRSSTSVKPSTATQMIETNIVEEPVDTEVVPVEQVFTEHEQDIMDQWRLIHLNAGGANDSPRTWFRDYCIHQLHNGLEIPQEHLDIASRL